MPLLKSIVGEDFPLSHTRHYVDLDLNGGSHPLHPPFGAPDNFTYDAIAVFTFINKDHWDRFVAKCKQPDASRRLSEDDEKFQDYKKLKPVFIEDTKSTGRDGGEVGWRFVGSV